MLQRIKKPNANDTQRQFEDLSKAREFVSKHQAKTALRLCGAVNDSPYPYGNFGILVGVHDTIARQDPSSKLGQKLLVQLLQVAPGILEEPISKLQNHPSGTPLLPELLSTILRDTDDDLLVRSPTASTKKPQNKPYPELILPMRICRQRPQLRGATTHTN